MIAVSAEAHSSTPSTRAPHARVPTVTPEPGQARRENRRAIRFSGLSLITVGARANSARQFFAPKAWPSIPTRVAKPVALMIGPG
jgi:hypothetical protein